MYIGIGGGQVGSKEFFNEISKIHILYRFHAFEPLLVQIDSLFCLWRIKGTLQKSQNGYISPIEKEFPSQPNSTKINVSRTKLENDQSKE